MYESASDTDTVNSTDDNCINYDENTSEYDMKLIMLKRDKIQLRAKIRHLRREAIKKDKELKQLVEICQRNDKKFQEYLNNKYLNTSNNNMNI